MYKIIKCLLVSAVLFILFPYTAQAAESVDNISFDGDVQTYGSGDILMEDTESGAWHVYNDGKINYSYNGLFENIYGWWYIRDGSIDWAYSGLVENAYGWWYVRNGSIDWNYSGLVENAYGWWYVRNGSIDWNYSGLVENAYGWWYVRNGSIDWNYSGLVENAYGWWYVRNGSIDWNYSGLVENAYGWWYVRNGSIDWNYSGLVENAYGWWYVRNGSIDWNYSGLVENAYGWWYVKGGSINWGYTGVAENAYGWWYIRNGSIDWTYSGTVQYNGENYDVINGGVQQDISWVRDLDVAKTCSQLVMVSVYNKNYATVSMHLKNGNHWKEIFSVEGRIGSAGIGKTREGDKKTPTGVYGLHTPFGIKDDPGCPLGYTKVNENHYWGGQPAKYYNKFVDVSKVSDYREGGGEHIIDYGAVYNYCVAVDYNPECIVGKGSAIFLHCKGKGATAGCISIPEENMVTVLQNLRSDAKIVIDSTENIMNY